MNKKRRSGFAISARLIGLVRPMLPIMLLAIFMGVLGFLCAIFITVFGGYAMLSVLDFTTPFSIKFIFIAVMIFALLRGVLRYAEQACNHYIAFKLLALIRDKVFRALRRLSPAKLETKDKGNLISIITTDIELLEVFYAHTISPIAIAFLVSLLMSLFLLQFHWILSFIAVLAYITVGIFIPLIISKLAKKAGMEYRNDSGQLSSNVLESLRGLQQILQFNFGEARANQIQNETMELGKKQTEMKKFEGISSALSNLSILVFSLSILFSSILLFQKNAFDFSGVLIPFIAIISSFGPVVALANLANNLVSTFASADRVLDILDEQPMVEDKNNGVDVEFDGMKCSDVSFSYNNELVLESFDFSIEKNKIIGIQGKSGSGKSTLLRLLMRFWDVDSGEVSMSSQNIKKINTQSLRKNQGLVTQQTIIFSDTIENNIKIANQTASSQQVEEACKKAAIHDFITSLPNGYQTKADELGSNFSGGQRQRIGLARAFLHDSPFILLDEPTSSIDSLNEGIILKAIANESFDKTVLIVSHKESSLGIADNVFSMKSIRNS